MRRTAREAEQEKRRVVELAIQDDPEGKTVDLEWIRTKELQEARIEETSDFAIMRERKRRG